jgi:signal recognition particle receptor subunit alpha
MLDSLTVISKGGLILYQHYQQPDNADESKTDDQINNLIATILLDPTKSSQVRYISNGTVAEWLDSTDFFVVILYPEVVLRSSKSVAWLSSVLMESVRKEYALFADAADRSSTIVVPDTALFDKTFQILWKQALKEKDNSSSSSTMTSSQQDMGAQQQQQRRNLQAAAAKGKEKRHWGEAKVTKQAMADLDFSKDSTDGEGDDTRALLEARAAYLPSSEEMPEWETQDEDLDDGAEGGDTGWGSSLKGLMDQMSGNKVLTDADLDKPLQDMQRQLTSKNVANDIADEICTNVRAKLVGKKMQSFSRVKTAVRQALEVAVTKILAPNKARAVDPLRGAIAKRDGGIFGSRGGGKRPFVISFIGINGVGKVSRWHT